MRDILARKIGPLPVGAWAAILPAGVGLSWLIRRRVTAGRTTASGDTTTTSAEPETLVYQPKIDTSTVGETVEAALEAALEEPAAQLADASAALARALAASTDRLTPPAPTVQTADPAPTAEVQPPQTQRSSSAGRSESPEFLAALADLDQARDAADRRDQERLQRQAELEAERESLLDEIRRLENPPAEPTTTTRPPSTRPPSTRPTTTTRPPSTRPPSTRPPRNEPVPSVETLRRQPTKAAAPKPPPRTTTTRPRPTRRYIPLLPARQTRRPSLPPGVPDHVRQFLR